MHLLLPWFSLRDLVGAMVLFAALYSVTGGLRSVMITQTIQASIMLISAGLVVVFALEHAGGWSAVISHLNARSRSLFLPASDHNLPWTGLLSGIPLLTLYFWCTNQLIVQHTLSACSLTEGRRGSLFAGFLKLTVLPLIILPGLCAIVIYPHLTNGDVVYSTLVFDLLPTGVIGVVVAGFLCSVMSNAASALNAIASVLTLDILPQILGSKETFNQVRVGHIAIIVVLIIVTLWAPEIVKFPSLWEYLQSVLAFVVP